MNDYQENGYLVVRNYFNEDELQALRAVVQDFHGSWKRKNADFYAKKAVNSAYITGKEHLNDPQRAVLFKFIGSCKLMSVVTEVIKRQPTFMNTQLFFNPFDKSQKNYWHRDPQYHLSIAEQKAALLGPQVVHFRIPLLDEPGLELVPGTHKRWDTNEEFDVRLEHNNRKNHEDLTTGLKIELAAGDLLVFSANMIHRGLYGMQRLSLDILFCDPQPSLVKFVKDDCLPSPAIILTLENADAFKSTIGIKRHSG